MNKLADLDGGRSKLLLAVAFAFGALLGGAIVFAATDDDPADLLTTPVGQATQPDTVPISDVKMVNITGSRNTQGACENPGLLEGQLEIGKPTFVGLVYVDDATCTFQVSIGTITGDLPNDTTSVSEEETAISPYTPDLRHHGRRARPLVL